MHEVTVRHNFEAGHRLPHLPGKCQSLHGHSWWAHVTVTGPQLENGILVDFGALKKEIREWIDSRLDHGTMLGHGDPLTPLLRAHECKVYEVAGWPTVENVATMIAAASAEALGRLEVAPGCHLARVTVRETHLNEATWTA
jgi:6-pyruvoyltetrahydropterin/6-carboxytetrahydropterin synthase